MKNRFRLFMVLAALSSAFTATVTAQENYTQWSKFRTITLNTSATGANTAAGLNRYPLLVRLDSNAADVFAGAKANGADIRFVSATGARLQHEIELWDSAGKKAAFWVRLDTVLAASSAQSVRMYWGKADAVDSSNAAAVFAPANGWIGVWHMTGANTSGSTTPDATGNGHTGTLGQQGAVDASSIADTSFIGLGKTFMGTNNNTSQVTTGFFYQLADANNQLRDVNTTNGPYTVSAWVVPRQCHGTGRLSIISKYSNANGSDSARGWALQMGNNADWRLSNAPEALQTATTTSINADFYQSGTCVAGAPTYLSGSYSNVAAPVVGTSAGVSLWVNDTASNIALGAGGAQGSSIGDKAVPYIGRLHNLERFFRGAMDEVRVHGAALPADWKKLDYATQKPGANAVALSSTVTQGPVTNFAFTDAAKAADTVVWVVGVPVNLTASYTGGPVDSCAITSGQTSLPGGVTLNKQTCTFTGTPTGTIAAANRTITAYSTFGNVTRTVRRSAVEAPASALKYSTDTASYLVGLPINANVPSWNGRALTAFTVNPALPAGLALNASSGAITGTPTGAVAAANYTVQGTNTIGPDSLTAIVRITVTAASAEDYTGSAWPNKQVIWLNTQSNGAAVASGLGKFPTLVRLDSSNFNAGFAQAGAGGKDIRFTKPNNTTRLPHQIERWDAAAKKAEIWVLVDTVMGSRLDSIRMHWGNVSAPNLSSGPQVFDTANGFQAVWHMSAATGGEADATANGFGAVGSGGPGTGVGSIGPARVLNGTSQFFHVPGSAAGRLNFTQADSYTLSSWMNPTAITQATSGNGHKIIDKGDNQYVLATYGNDPSTRYWEITIRGNNAWNQCQADGAFAGSVAVPADSSVGAWHHLVGTYTGGPVGSAVTQRLYYDGKQVAECPITNDAADGRNENFNVHLGVQAAGTAPGTTFSRYWNGLLDEPRLSNRPRSADWIKLEYANQRPTGQNFVAFTRPNIVSLKGALAGRTGGDLSMKALGRGMAFRLETEQGFTASLALVDVWGRTVWSGDFVNGALSWNGRTATGSDAAPGLYLARVTVRDAAGKPAQTLNRRVPYTR